MDKVHRIIIHFTVGADKLRCRLVVPGPGAPPNDRDRMEKQTTDALDVPTWVPVDSVKGLPAGEILIRRALVVLLTGPNAATRTGRLVEIDLGEVR